MLTQREPERAMRRGQRMRSKRKSAIQAVVLPLLVGVLAGLLVSCRKAPNALRGAVLERNSDPRKESPIANVEITASIGSNTSSARTDNSGYFSIPLRGWIQRGQSVRLSFRRPGYESLELNESIGDKLYIVHLAPTSAKAQPEPARPATGIANVRIRYSMKTTAVVNVGSAVKTFEVVNKGNVPCNGHLPCSPDGKWKADIVSARMEAGEGSEFRNVRLSCIAGPCPFTRVEADGYSRGGNKISAAVLGWSDTTTFLFEAEVYRPMQSEIIQEAHPAIFGRNLNFSVPNTGEGVSLEADVNGEAMVFPMGPSLCLSWADCSVATDTGHNKSYRCELKPGYRFQ